MTRPLALYLRSRSAPATLAIMAGCAIGLGALEPTVDDPISRSRLALLATALAVAAIGPGLAGADLDLDRLSGFAWPPRRAAYLIIGAAVAAGLIAATTLVGDPMTDVNRIARDAAGFTGLVGLGAAGLGASRAPLVPVLWTVVVLGVQPPADRTDLVVLSWMAQPVGSLTGAATVTGVVIAVVGTLAYATCGPRRQ